MFIDHIVKDTKDLEKLKTNSSPLHSKEDTTKINLATESDDQPKLTK